MRSTDAVGGKRRGTARRTWLVALLCCCLALVLGFAVMASAQEDAAQAPTDAPQWLRDRIGSSPAFARHAQAANDPQVGSPDPASDVEFRDLGPVEAAQSATDAFPGLIRRPVDLTPDLSRGERITRYLSPTVARLELPNGEHAVMESKLPMLTETPAGKTVVPDLSLREETGTIEPVHPLVPVEIPLRLDEGISLPASELTVTPVDGSGNPLRGAKGTIEGATAFFANTQTDTDTVAKPLPEGFETQTLLRSPASPEALQFAIGASADSSLNEAGDGSISVVSDGDQIASIAPVSAVDARGTEVPVTTEIDDGELLVGVEHRSGEYQYPIAVDPTVTEVNGFSEAEGTGNWTYGSNAPSIFAGTRENTNCGYSSECLKISDPSSATYSYGQGGNWVYPTQGSSRIYEFDALLEGMHAVETKAATIIAIESTSEVPEAEYFAGYYGSDFGASFGKGPYSLCPAGGCASSGGSAENVAVFEQVATGTGTHSESDLLTATVKIAQDTGPSIGFDTASNEIEGHINPLYGSGRWVKSATEARVKATATDPGIGIYKRGLTAPSYSTWNKKTVYGAASGCVGVQCDSPYTVQGDVGNLPEGENTIEAKVENATGASAAATAKLKVDNTAPYGSAINLPEDATFALGHTYKLEFSFGDGKAPTASSGVAEHATEVDVDGKSLMYPTAAPGCTPGPCEIKRSIDLETQYWGAGTHILEITAEDKAGNTSTSTASFSIHHGPLVDVGPGKVDTAGGEFSLTSGDVSGGPGLSVTRSYDSRNHPWDPVFNDSVAMEWGGGWTMGLGGWQGITKLTDGTAVLGDSRGRSLLFAPLGGGKFKVPAGYEGWSLTYSEAKPDTYTLTDPNGSVTTFQRPGEVGSFYAARTFAGPNGISLTTFQFEELGDKKFHPTKATGPIPSGVSCTTPAKGCRILYFTYAASTTASGLNPSQWGNYKYALQSVSLEAWDPQATKMTKTAVVEYAYDNAGYLRASWDPRISPALKTTYGYANYENWLLTSVTESGRQPWMLHYGTFAYGEASGRLMSATRPVASTTLSPEAPAPANTALPRQSKAHPMVGVARHVWNGTWSNGPLSYSYQWEACDPGCSPIANGHHRNYTPVAADVGKRLRVQVVAANGTGATNAYTVTSSKVLAAGTSHYVSSCQLTGIQAPTGAVVEPGTGNLWVVNAEPLGAASTIREYAPECGKLLKAFGAEGTGAGQFSKPKGIAMNTAGELFVADGSNRVEVVKQSGEFVRNITNGVSNPQDVEVAHPGGGADRVWVTTDYGANARVAQYSETGTFEAYEETWGFGSQVFTDPAGLALGTNHKFVADRARESFISTGSPATEIFPAYGNPSQIAIATPGSGEDVFVGATTKTGTTENAALFKYNQKGELLGEFGIDQVISPPTALASGTKGEVYVGLSGDHKVEMWTSATSEKGEGESETPPANPETSTWTIDYEVPLSGEGAPNQMSSSAVAEWGQEKTPASATAIWPPDSVPDGGKTDYKRATIYYMDFGGRNIDTAAPGGRLEARAYDSHENVTRELSPGNLKKALELKGSSAERAALAKELDTQYTYGAEGQELQSVLGPKHLVKLDNDTEAQARLKTRYYFDEGAPGGGTYHLATKQTEAALVGSEERDAKTKTFGYSGQANLGWTLRAPTMTTTDPAGLHLVEKTVYDPKTGYVVESRLPGNPSGSDAHSERIINYTAAENKGTPECGGHPEWDGLPCQELHGGGGSKASADSRGVACVGEECFRVGRSNDEKTVQIEHWDGTEWSLQSAPIPSEGSQPALQAISCSAANACTAVGSYTKKGRGQQVLVERWDGSKWSSQSITESFPRVLNGVSCSSATACTAVGYIGEVGNTNTTAWIEYWNGTTWAEQTLAAPKSSKRVELTGVSCTASNACTAVGGYASEGKGEIGTEPLAARWNGTSWTQQTTVNPTVPLPRKVNSATFSGVSCSSATACTAVGNWLSSNEGAEQETVPLAEAWNGTTWAMQSTQEEPLSKEETIALEGPLYFSSAALGGVECTVSASLGLEPGAGAKLEKFAVASPGSCVLSGFMKSICSKVNSVSAAGQPLSALALESEGKKTVGIEGLDLTYKMSCESTEYTFRYTGNLVGTPDNGEKMSSLGLTGTLHAEIGKENLGNVTVSKSTLKATPAAKYGIGKYGGVVAPHWTQEGSALPQARTATIEGPLYFSSGSFGSVECTLSAKASLEPGSNGRLEEISVPAPGSCKMTGTIKEVCAAVNSVTAVAAPWTLLATESAGKKVMTSKEFNLNYKFTCGGKEYSWPFAGEVTATPDNSDKISTLALTGTLKNSEFGSVTISKSTFNFKPAAKYGISTAPGPHWTKLKAYGSGENYFAGVSCTSASACTAVGRVSLKPFVQRFDGGAWSSQPAPVPPNAEYSGLNAVICTATESCAAAGERAWYSGAREPLSETWDGKSWVIQGAGEVDKTLPVVTTTYNIWNEPLVSTEVANGKTRTTTLEYDGAERLKKAGQAWSEGVAEAPVSTGYDEKTGDAVILSDGTKTLGSEFNSLGQIVGYTDADGNKSTYKYDIDGRLRESYDGKGTRTASYDAETGDLTKIEDTGVGAFTATYDSEGRLASETLPNGLKASRSYDAVGNPTKLSYEKTTHCSEKCTWYTDEAVLSIQSKRRSEATTKRALGYAYDADGRLIKVTDTPVGEGCTTRLYSYDADSNRTATTVRSPGGGGGCAIAGGATQSYGYDEADRLIDSGVKYNAFGDITELPAADAGGYPLTATYYVDDTIASLTQNGVTAAYNIDPLGRQRQTIVTGGEGAGETVSHYSGAGDAPAWISSGSAWTRYVGGISGLAAIQTSTGETKLQVPDLHGNVVATVPVSELATGLEFIDEANEYGVPRGKAPKKYSWLGSARRSTELASGIVNMGRRVYIPSIGRFAQTDPISGGGPNAYAYTWGDPVNQADLNGQYTPSYPTWLLNRIGTAPSMPPPPPTAAEEAEEAEESAEAQEWDGGVSGRSGGPMVRLSRNPFKPTPPDHCGKKHWHDKGCVHHPPRGCGERGVEEACPGDRHPGHTKMCDSNGVVVTMSEGLHPCTEEEENGLPPGPYDPGLHV